MRQMRKWQKQYGNRTDPRQHVKIRVELNVSTIKFVSFQQQAKQREPSVRIRDDWQVIEEIPFSGLSKMSLPSVGEPEEMSDERTKNRTNLLNSFLF